MTWGMNIYNSIHAPCLWFYYVELLLNICLFDNHLKFSFHLIVLTQTHTVDQLRHTINQERRTKNDERHRRRLQWIEHNKYTQEENEYCSQENVPTERDDTSITYQTHQLTQSCKHHQTTQHKHQVIDEQVREESEKDAEQQTAHSYQWEQWFQHCVLRITHNKIVDD